MDAQTIIDKWQENQIKPLKKERMEGGKVRLHYEEKVGNKWKKMWIDCDSLYECDELLLTIGGKNEETCAARPNFLDLGTFTVEDLLDIGHEPRRITVQGAKPGMPDRNHIDFPNGCGSPYFNTSQKKIAKKDQITKTYHQFWKTGNVTRQFDNSDEFNSFQMWLLSHDELEKFNWKVKLLVTLSRDTNQMCKWVCKKAGDGSKTMELQLHEIDGKIYQKHTVADIFSAAGDMAWKECALMDIDKIVGKDWICKDALLQGKVKM